MADDVINPSPEPAAPAEIPLEQVVERVFGKDPEAATAGDGKSPPVAAKGDEPVNERVTAKIAAGLRAEKRAAEARRERIENETALTKARAELEQQKAAVAEQVKLAEQIKAAKLSPSEALKLLGTDAKSFLETLATENDPSKVAARAVEGTTTELEKVRAEIKALRDEQAARERSAKQAEADQHYNAATQQFLEKVDAAPDKYPHLIAEYTPAELAHAARDVAEKHGEAFFKKYGEHPDDDVIAEYLETQAQKRAEALAERRARVGQKAPVPSRGEPSGELRAAQPDRGPSPRTLSSRQSSQRSNAPRPWSQEAADEESMRILQGAIK